MTCNGQAAPLSSGPPKQPLVKQLTEAQQAKAERIRAIKQEKAAEAAAKKAERKAKKEQTDGGAHEQGPPDKFLKREWVHVSDSSSSSSSGTVLSVLTWNMLAQALVRRELFPGSDFLKVKDRVPQLMKEVLYYSPDIACLQEVDRLGDHLPALNKTHGHTSFIGYPNKPHGLLIAHKKSVFERVGSRGIRLDELPIRDPDNLQYHEVESDVPEDGVEKATAWLPIAGQVGSRQSMRTAAGLSRATRNVGLFVALKFKQRPGGIIIGTTHLFWHPKHVYERVRQTAILLREARRFQREANDGAWRDWPLFLAGDFNAQPEEATYQLLMGNELTQEQQKELSRSTVIHQSVDKIYQADSPEDQSGSADAGNGDEGEQAQEQSNDDDDEDKVIKNCRLPTEEDGLASLEELSALLGIQTGQCPRLVSAYGEIGGLIDSEDGKRYGDRDAGVYSGESGAVRDGSISPAKNAKVDRDGRIRQGDFEPMWTNFTPLWRLSIDYVFYVPWAKAQHELPRFTSLLSTHSTETLGRGLPRSGVSASDHVAIGTRVVIPEITESA
ncbi:RNA exonuclease ngl2 [Microbotryomycetes sp. JL201]|nr:RNA exonuclease ngl2 [Microbotryomycetes sp. JL201]